MKLLKQILSRDVGFYKCISKTFFKNNLFISFSFGNSNANNLNIYIPAKLRKVYSALRGTLYGKRIFFVFYVLWETAISLR